MIFSGLSRAEARRLLSKWGGTDAYIRRQHAIIEDRRADMQSALSLRCQNLDGMPHGGQVTDPTARAAEQLLHLTERYAEAVETAERRIADALDLKDAVDEALDLLSERQVRVLEYRYRGGRSWTWIGRMLGCDTDSARRIERKAVDRLRFKNNP